MKRPSFARAAPAITAAGKRFGFDAHYFAKNTAAVTFAQVINVLKGIITGYLVTLLFLPEQYGEYRFILSIVGVLGVLGLPGLPSTLAAAIARKEPVSLPSVIRWHAMFGGIGSLALLACIPLLSLWDREALWPLFLAAALLFTPSIIGTGIFSSVIRGTGAFTVSFYATFTASIAIAVSTLVMLLLYPSPLILLIIVTGIPAIVYWDRLRVFIPRYRSKTSARPIIRKALHLSTATIPTSLSWYLDGLLISAFFGLNQMALFSVALLIPEQIKMWMKELFPVLFLKQAEGKDTAEKRRKMAKAVQLGTLIFALGIGAYILLAPFFIPLLFPNYPASELISLTSVAALALITIPLSIYNQYLEARGHIAYVRNCNWISSAVFVLALVALVPTYGPLGALIARILFRVTFSACGWYFVRRIPVSA